MAAGSGWVLVVEDDRALGSLIQQQVKDKGHVCERASDGAAALQTIVMARREPALVLLDLHLPAMEGEPLALEIRRLLGKQVPIVIVSGRAREQLAGVARRIGAAVLPKPFDLCELDAVLDRYLHAPRPQRLAIRRKGRELQPA